MKQVITVKAIYEADEQESKYWESLDPIQQENLMKGVEETVREDFDGFEIVELSVKVEEDNDV